MSNLDEFFARKDKKKAGKKFATTKDVVKTLVKKQQAEEALRKEQEMLQNAVLEKASRTSLDKDLKNLNTLRLSASSIEDASGSEGASRSKMRVRGLKARRGKGWKKVSSAPYVTPPVRNINLDREASTSVAEPTTILNINSRTSFPTLSGGRKATPSTETSGSRASEGKSVEEDQGNRKDELPKLERQESKMTLRSVCECFEEDADE